MSRDLKRLKNFIDDPWHPDAHLNLWHGLEPMATKTPQGEGYWVEKYYHFYKREYPSYGSVKSSEMTEDDWSYLRSLFPKEDPFLTDKKNKEFIV